MTALMDAAQGLFLQSRQAAGLIAGRGIFIDYLAVADGWLYFTNRTWAALDNGGRRQEWSLWARQLETGEEVLVQNECGPLRLITDGTWCYLSDGNTTDCYRLEHDGQGRPCGLTLVEETI